MGEYFATENINENKFLADYLKDDSGICLDLSTAKGLFCWKTGHMIFNESTIFPNDYYKVKPLHENFLDLGFYISDDRRSFYEVTSKGAFVTNDADGSSKLKFDSTLLFLANYLSFSEVIIAKKKIGHTEIFIWLDRENLTMDHTDTSKLDDTELRSKNYFQCRVEEPRKLLSDHLKLQHLWSDYFHNKSAKYKF